GAQPLEVASLHSIDMASVRAIRTGNATCRSSGGRTISSWSGGAGPARGGRTDAWSPGELGAGDGRAGTGGRCHRRMLVSVVEPDNDHNDGDAGNDVGGLVLVQRPGCLEDPDRRGGNLFEDRSVGRGFRRNLPRADGLF